MTFFNRKRPEPSVGPEVLRHLHKPSSPTLGRRQLLRELSRNSYGRPSFYVRWISVQRSVGDLNESHFDKKSLENWAHPRSSEITAFRFHRPSFLMSCPSTVGPIHKGFQRVRTMSSPKMKPGRLPRRLFLANSRRGARF